MWHTVRSCDVQYEVMWSSVWVHVTYWHCLIVCHIADIVWGNIVWHQLMIDYSHLSRPVSCLPEVQTAPGESREPQDDLQAAPWYTCKRFTHTYTHTLLYHTIQCCTYSVQVLLLAVVFAACKDRWERTERSKDSYAQKGNAFEVLILVVLVRPVIWLYFVHDIYSPHLPVAPAWPMGPGIGQKNMSCAVGVFTYHLGAFFKEMWLFMQLSYLTDTVANDQILQAL